MLSTIDEHGSKIDRNSVFSCHLSPHWRQMAMENTVSIDFWRQMAIENTVSIDFLLISSIVLALSIAAHPVWKRCSILASS